MIESILDEGIVCHTAYISEDGFPVVIPMLYVRDGSRLLLHGSNSMGIAHAVRHGSPLCVAVTHIDGLVVARSAFESSANYRSVVVHGNGRLISDRNEKRQALDLITDRLLPGRLADVRPSTDSEVGQAAVIELRLDEVSAKVRTGGPIDQPEDLASPVWAGVIPLRLVAEPPIPADDLAPGIEIPAYVSEFVSKRSQ